MNRSCTETTISPSINRVCKTSWDESHKQPTDRVPFITYHSSLSSLRTINQQNHQILETSERKTSIYLHILICQTILYMTWKWTNDPLLCQKTGKPMDTQPSNLLQAKRQESRWIHNLQTCYITEIIITVPLSFITLCCAFTI